MRPRDFCQDRESHGKSMRVSKSDDMSYNMIGFIDFAQVKFRKLSFFAE